MEQAVYITGAGIISAIGVGKAATLQSLLSGTSGVGPLRYLDTIHTDLPAGEVKLSDDEMRRELGVPASLQTNRTSLLGSMALREALADAGLTAEMLTGADATIGKDGKAAWLISGTTVGGMDYTERHYLDMLSGDEHLVLLKTHTCGSTTDAMAATVGLQHMHKATPSTACSSAANAIIMGCNLIKTGRADIVIAGGAEALSKFHYNGFNTLMILDHEQCRPFDESRAGLNLGEGAAFVVLESEASVRQRGQKPRYQISGYGNACDAFHQTATSDNGEGAFRAMSEALQMAGMTSSDIQYVNAHGTGTPNNDLTESAALRRVFATEMPAVSSTKAFTGHTTSASGSIETVICMLAMGNSFLPVNLGWTNQMADGITPVNGAPAANKAELQHVMCNSFGFGGNDSSLIISKVADADAASANSDAMVLTDTDAAPIPSAKPAAKPQVYVRSLSIHRPSDGPADVSEFVPKLEARRMCRLLKSALQTSLTALRDAGLPTKMDDESQPLGIITGTRFGMFENSEKFLIQMCEDGEELLKPTLFMQSTHNTIGGLLGIRTHCHGYNTTFSDDKLSLQNAITDACLQLELGGVENVLVGMHDELTPNLANMLCRLDGKTEHAVGETSVAMVLNLNPEGAVCSVDDLDISALSHL